MVLPPGHHLNITTRRAYTPLEKWMLGAALAGVAVFAVVLVIALTRPAHTAARGCVDVTIVGATGAARIHQCDANARELCRSAATATGEGAVTVRDVRAACRKAGFPVG